MKALSIRQPWAWLIAEGHKNVENRTWTTRYRGPLVIHAGTRCGRRECVDAIRWCAHHLLPIPPAWYTKEVHYGGIIATAMLVDVVEQSGNPWFEGPYGWVLEDVRRIEFKPFKGMLGLFNVPDSLIEV